MKKETILVADRDRETVETVRQAARKLRCACIQLPGARDALKAAARFKPATVLLGLGASSWSDGLAVARTLRDRFDLPVICLGDNTVTQARIRKARAEFFSFLAKPPVTQELETVLGAALECEKLEEVVRSHTEWHREMLNAMSDGLLATDHTGKVVFLNPAAERLTGLVAKRVVGKGLPAVLKVSGIGRQAGVSVANALRHGATRTVGKQAVLRGEDGREARVDISASPIRYASGKAAGVVLVLRDISDRQTMTKRMLTEQKMKAVGTLARGIAHDFSSIIGTIGGHAASMVDSLISETRAHEDALRIVEATKRAQDLVNRLLSLARASEPQGRETPKPVPVMATVAAAANLFHGTFKEKNIEISMKGSESVPYIKGNSNHLLDALICLFLNSADAMARGGTLAVNVSVRKITKPNIRLNPRARRGSYVVISVSDTGSGMPRRVLNRLFEPFFTTKETPTARGLGLTVVRTTIERWGGWITVQSHPGHGTTFDLHIPEARTRHVPAAPIRAKGGTVLVMDNKPADLAVFQDFLESAGYKVITAATARKGIGLYRKSAQTISAVVIDLIMADHDGKAAYEAVRAINPEASVVMASGFSRDYVRSHLGSGGWGFVQKPIEKNLLLEAVGRMITRKPETVLDLPPGPAGEERRSP